MGANAHANGGILKKALRLPDFRAYGVKVEQPGQIEAENTPPLGALLRDVMRANADNFGVFGPDENTSNNLHAIYETSRKLWLAEYFPEDSDGTEIAPDGRVVEMLSEHTMEGMLEGYLLTGRHGFLSTYEAFVHVIDSCSISTRSGSPWEFASTRDDTLVQSNVRGTVTFATSGPNTRTTQLFINLEDNTNLNAMGFTPVGQVIEGMDVVDKLHAGYGDGPPFVSGPDQQTMAKEGNAYLEREFPQLDFIRTARVVSGSPSNPAAKGDTTK